MNKNNIPKPDASRSALSITDKIARERSGLPPKRVDGTGATQTLKLVLAAGL
jgi:hypothetical protein